MHIPISAVDFMFDGKKLSDFGMMLCNFTGSSSNDIAIGNKIVYMTAKPPMNDRNLFVNAIYEDMVTATVQICRNRCVSNASMGISPDEISSILSWLVRKDGYHKLKFFQEGYESIFFNAYFNDVQLVKSGGIIYGLTLSIMTDSPYGYEETVNIDIDMNAGIIYRLTNLSDEMGITVPSCMSVYCKTNGDMCISNISDENRKVCVANCSSGEIITFDCIHKIISSSNMSHKICNDFNYNYFRLVSTYSDRQNLITSNMDCHIHLAYNPVRKVGIV